MRSRRNIKPTGFGTVEDLKILEKLIRREKSAFIESGAIILGVYKNTEYVALPMLSILFKGFISSEVSKFMKEVEEMIPVRVIIEVGDPKPLEESWVEVSK